MVALRDKRQAQPFSLPLFEQICHQWQAWKIGIPPGREWKGRGAQNPRLLRAFAVLDLCEARISAGPGREGTDDFAARIKRQVQGS